MIDKPKPLTPEEFTRRREIEREFAAFCENKTGDALDKLKMFLFEELAKLHLKLENK